ncbi:MAG: lipopolysaccharide heptosyltransferase II [Verrucomicrobiota bacterium]
MMIDSLGESVLLRSPNWLGDAIMCMPAMGCMLKTNSSQRRFTVLAPPKLQEIWKMLPGIIEVLPAEKDILKTILTIKSRKFDSAILFPNSLRSALEVFLSGIPTRIGYRGHARKWLLTHVFEKIKTEEKFEHQKMDYLRLARHIGFDAPDHATLPEIQQPAERMIGDAYVAVCPGAEYGPAKRWPSENFAEAAAKISEIYHLKIVLLGAECDRESVEEVKKNLNGDCIDVAGKTTLKEFFQYLAHAKLVLCNDSGAMHSAALLRAPTIALFGSTEPALTGPLSDSVRVIREPIHCSPCFLRQCPTEFSCMRAISVEKVIQTAQEI